MIEHLYSLHWYEIGICLNALLAAGLFILAIFLEFTYLGIYIVTEQNKNYKSFLSWLVKYNLLPRRAEDHIRENSIDENLFLILITLGALLTLSVTWPLTILLIVFCLIVFPAKLIRKKLLEIRDDTRREAREDREDKREDREIESKDECSRKF